MDTVQTSKHGGTGIGRGRLASDHGCLPQQLAVVSFLAFFKEGIFASKFPRSEFTREYISRVRDPSGSADCGPDLETNTSGVDSPNPGQTGDRLL